MNTSPVPARLRAVLAVCALSLAGCASLPNRDPLSIDVAGIEGLPSDGMEIRLAVKIRIQNPNDVAVEYTGVALDLDLNGRKLASGVADTVGVVPRYGETVFTVPVTISAFNVVRQVLGFANGAPGGEISYAVRGKLEGGWLGTRRFSDTGTFRLDQPTSAR